MKRENELFKDKNTCSACGACFNICPKRAISMVEDKEGYIYPLINTKECINCGLCEKVCNFKNKNKYNKSIEAKAAMSTNKTTLANSASGGVFYTIASNVLKSNGVVYGCSLENKDKRLSVEHIRVVKLDNLRCLQGSKYIQSKISDCYKQIKSDLNSNRLVLFSGTPCQVDGLYGYLGNKEYSGLFTIDIICHGVPNEKIFLDYIEVMEKRLKGKIIDVCFRDKSQGWSLKGSLIYIDKKGIKRKKMMPLQGFPYYKMFLDSILYRDNCYSCKYASIDRVGDLTIGDYWGIEEEHPDYLTRNGGEFNEELGISCILVNSSKGKELLDRFSQNLILKNSTVDTVKKINFQLQKPSHRSENRDYLLYLYKQFGYKRMEKEYYKKFGLKSIIYKVWNYIPGVKINSL